MDTPAHRRGLLYPTAQTAGCVEFHQCRRCRMCRSYNQNNLACTMCESNKVALPICRCTPEQEAVIVRLEELMGRPMIDPNRQPNRPVVQRQIERDPERERLSEEIRRSIRST